MLASRCRVMPSWCCLLLSIRQAAIGRYWSALTAGGEEGQCGWLKDKYGVSWQIVPTALPKMLQDKNAKKSEAMMKALMPMKKLDLAKLKRAFDEAGE